MVSFALQLLSCYRKTSEEERGTSVVNTTNKEYAEMDFQLQSPAFKDKGDIPELYTCKGKELSPALAWTSAPAGTVSFALIVEDPITSFWAVSHWVVYNIPPDKSELAEGIPHVGSLPDGTCQGKNFKRDNGYMGPCPIRGTRTYRFTIFALDTMFGANPGMRRAGLLRAMKGHILAEASIVGHSTKK